MEGQNRNVRNFSHKTFDTRPKTRRRGRFQSGCTAKDFMGHLWDKGLCRKASYETLCYEFLQFTDGCDNRTLAKYLGKPSTVVRYSAHMVRMERNRGRVASFDYHHKRTTIPRKGLLERLGYITDLKDGSFKLNFEGFPYFAEQVALEVPPHSPLQETTE